MPTYAGTPRRSLLLGLGSVAVAAPFSHWFPGMARATARPVATVPGSAWSDLQKSSYMKAEGITPELVGRMLGWARRMPVTSMDSVFKFFQVGGRINAPRPDETACLNYPRLQRVKRQVDKTQLFRHRQSIEPA